MRDLSYSERLDQLEGVALRWRRLRRDSIDNFQILKGFATVNPQKDFSLHESWELVVTLYSRKIKDPHHLPAKFHRQ